MTAPLRLRLDSAALISNWRHMAKLSGSAACGAAIKANGYGLGSRGVAERLAAA
ncbi:MAG TPA: alanine racemase, partial [Sphingomonas sp.]|nr:alanine racemase [Sphingomonas sp.]